MSLDKPWAVDAVLLMCAGLFVSLSTGWIVAIVIGLEPDDKFGAFVISTLSFHGAVLVFSHLFVRAHGMTWSEAFGFKRPGAFRALLLSVGLTVIVLPCAWFLGQLSARSMIWFQLEPAVQEAVTTLQSTVDIPQQFYMAGAAVLLVPVAEELLFRGVLYPWIKGLGWPRAAFWGTAILFGAVHMTLMTFVPLTFLGLCLTWLYEKTGNLLAPIFAHSLFNLANLMLLVFLPPA